MKNKPVIFAVLILSILSAAAQGVVHLGPGDNYLFSNPNAHTIGNETDGHPHTALEFNVVFGVDSFGSGDSYQMDAFFPTTAAIPMATVVLDGPFSGSFSWVGVAWPLGQPGAFRMTMLAGSVDVRFIQAVSNNNSTFYDLYYFIVPEPGASLLVAVGVGLFGGARRLKHRKR